MNSIDTLPTNDLDVLQLTAKALEVSEYQIFVEAYRAWHGEKPRSRQIDVLFSKYLSRGEIPAFVRHFTRHYLAAHPEYLRKLEAQQRNRQLVDRLSLLLLVIMVLVVLLFF